MFLIQVSSGFITHWNHVCNSINVSYECNQLTTLMNMYKIHFSRCLCDDICHSMSPIGATGHLAPHAIREAATCTRTPWATNDMYNLHTIKLVACARDIYSHRIMDTATLLWLPTHNIYLYSCGRTGENLCACCKQAQSAL